MPEPTHHSVPSGTWRRLRLTILVPLARLRFLLILAAIGLVIVKWDYLAATWARWFPSADAAASGNFEYFCPMHPAIVRDTNKEKCPVCAMPLSRRKKIVVAADAEPLPAGTTSRVQLSPYRIVLAGVKTEPVAYHPLTKEINVVGTVEFDERELKNVSARVKGRIETLFVNQTGQLVKERAPLASVYSPELAATVENLLSAHKSNNVEMERNAAERLKLWGIDDEEIKKIIKDDKPVTNLTIRSPFKGDSHVIKKYVREGQYVEEGASLYDLADISTVWVQAQLYEDDVAFLPKGTHDPKTGFADKKLKATATARAFPGREFEGTLSFVFPHLDQDSRTLTVRFVLDNKEHELRPGMTAAVSLKLDMPAIAELQIGKRLQRQGDTALAIPEQSVIDTGAIKLVYREEIRGIYEAVKVELGPRMSGPAGEVLYPLLKGRDEKFAGFGAAFGTPALYVVLKAQEEKALAEGDRVVTSGSFLVDAETRLNHAAGSIYVGGSAGGKEGPPANVRPSTSEDNDGKIADAIQSLGPKDGPRARAQKYCPIQGALLGSMDRIIKVELDGKPVFLCCKACIKEAKADPAGTLAKVKDLIERPKK